MTRLACRYHDGQIQWLLERPFSEPVWIYRTRQEAEMILRGCRTADRRGDDEYARQIEAALGEYDEAENEDDNEEWRYETEMANG